MEQKVKVISVDPDGTAKVIHLRESACSGDCHKCSGCGAVQQAMILTVKNPLGAVPGQFATISAATGPVLAGAAVLYLMPLVLFFAGYLVGESLWQQGMWGGGIAFVLSILLAVLYDRLVVKKKNTVYTITGLGGFPRTFGKEEENLD